MNYGIKQLSQKIKSLVNQINGFSTPFFGVSWNPSELDFQVASSLVTYLEDKRILFESIDDEFPEYCVKSVLQIRERLTEDLEKLDRSSPLAQSLRAMRLACRNFLDKCQEIDTRLLLYEIKDPWFTALRSFRQIFDIHLGIICTAYEVDVEPQLAHRLAQEIPGIEMLNIKDLKFEELI